MIFVYSYIFQFVHLLFFKPIYEYSTSQSITKKGIKKKKYKVRSTRKGIICNPTRAKRLKFDTKWIIFLSIDKCRQVRIGKNLISYFQ